MVQKEMVVEQIDFSTAYLNSEIDRPVYLKPPPGMDIPPGHCLKLKKALYGLRQSGNLWNTTINQHLISMGFTRSIVDTCLYTKREGDSEIILLLWVDDVILGGSSQKVLDEFKSSLKSSFKIKELGPLKDFLGIEFDCKSKTCITMSQGKYVDKILERFGLTNCNPKNFAMPHGHKQGSVYR